MHTRARAHTHARARAHTHIHMHAQRRQQLRLEEGAGGAGSKEVQDILKSKIPSMQEWREIRSTQTDVRSQEVQARPFGCSACVDVCARVYAYVFMCTLYMYTSISMYIYIIYI